MDNIVPFLTTSDKNAIRRQYGAVGKLHFIPVQYLSTIPDEVLNLDSFPYSNDEHTERWCYTCTSFKDVEKFPRINNYKHEDRERPGGHCKDCIRAKSNPTEARASHLKRTYDLTMEEYDLMFFQQAGVCAICKQPETMPDPYNPGKIRMLAVDHNHQTNQVRALLCGACNKMVGYLEKKRTVVGEAIKYLNSFD